MFGVLSKQFIFECLGVFSSVFTGVLVTETRSPCFLQVQYNTYATSGTVLHNYAHIFDLLTRLRQAVDHPCALGGGLNPFRPIW